MTRLTSGTLLYDAAKVICHAPSGCIEDADRHGNIRIYYRAKGRPKVRLRATPWTPEFMSEYDAAKGIEALVAASRSRAVIPGTWRWLCVRYFTECAEYKRLDPRTQHVRRMILEGTVDEPIAPGSAKPSGTSRFRG